MAAKVAGTNSQKPHVLGAGGISGAANAAALSVGNAKSVRITAGPGVTVSMAEVGTELQFTVSATAPGGLTSLAAATGIGVVSSLTSNPGFVPRLGVIIATFTIPFVQTSIGIGVFASAVTAYQLSISHGSGTAGPLYGKGKVAVASNWICTSFTSSNVTVGSGGTFDQVDMFVIGGS